MKKSIYLWWWKMFGYSKEIIMELEYNYIRDNDYGKFSSVRVGDKKSFINNKTGKLITNIRFDDVWDFENEFGGVKLNGKWNFIDGNGKILFDTWYDDIYPFGDNKFAAVKSNEKWNFIDKNGEYLSETWYENIYSFAQMFRDMRFYEMDIVNEIGKILSEMVQMERVMRKTDLCKEIGEEKFSFSGDCFQIEREPKDSNIIKLLEQICISEMLIPNHRWRKIDFDECSEYLLDALNFDLAYTRFEHMSREQATAIQKNIIERFNKAETECFTNWSNNVFQDGSGGWNRITAFNDFDMAIVFADCEKVIFTYFVGNS